MISWLRVEGEPVRLYFSDVAALAYLDAATAKHNTLVSYGDIREDTEGETGNVSVQIGKASRANFIDPPIGCIARIQSTAGDEFVGTIKKITVTADGITLSVEQ